MRSIPVTLMCLLVAGSMGVGGCSWFSHSTGPLIADARSPIADVPVPAGFTMTKDSTSKVIPGGMRIVDHLYKGSDDYLPVVEFYRNQMPDRGWTLNQQLQQGKEITLMFTNAKTNEDCSVSVKGAAFDTQIHIKIDPRGAPKQGD